jgi:hypothetical protein
MIEPDEGCFPSGFYLKLADLICGVRLPENMRSHPIRAVQRDILNGDQKWSANILQARYKRRYVPGQRLYLCEAQPKEQASIIVDNNGY